jgi:hypothetical protein
MFGHTNAEKERKLMLVEQRLVDVEEICGDYAKTMDVLADFCLEVNEWRRKLEEVTKTNMPDKFIE